MDLAKFEVPVDQLKIECDPNMFKFKCTKDLAPLREFIGQDRAIRGIEFGLSMKNKGYNIYVAGLSGTGKTSIVKRSGVASGVNLKRLFRCASDRISRKRV